VVSLRTKDVQVLESGLFIVCSEFKNVGSGGLPSMLISFPKLPHLYDLLV
jgi:hypothetical protein